MGEAIRMAYKMGQEDEALEPIVEVDSEGRPSGRLECGDSMIFYNIRGEREVEITRSLVERPFPHFPTKPGLRLNLVTMIEYDAKLKVKVAFPPQTKIKNTLTEVIGRAGMHLAKVAESEKAAHICFFLNGKNDGIFPGEKRYIVPSPQDVKSYADKPEMSVSLVAEEIFARLKDSSFQVIIANFANVDVVGHINQKDAALKAVEAVDRELGRVVREAQAYKATVLVTSDHGTVEEWLYPDGTVNTGHTKNPVPLILADFSVRNPELRTLKDKGELADVAPTVLGLMGLEKPTEMTGENLICTDLPEDKRRNKILLVILDGWGMREEKKGNLIAEADTPNFDYLWKNFPHTCLKASGESVGMPSNTGGNSEAGHLHLGAGRRVLLDRVRIDSAIEDGSFFSNKAFLWAMDSAKKKQKSLHLMGIVSHYSSHGTIQHLFALLRMAKKRGVKKVYIHCFIGRRGEKPESGAIYVEKVEEMGRALGLGQVVTVIGRHWALDREEHWDRVERTYKTLVDGEGTKVHSSGWRKT